jgi:hypothetical protein
MKNDPNGSQARKRIYHAVRLMPNRHGAPLSNTEQLAEDSDNQRTREAARETRNYPLIGALNALRQELRRQKRQEKLAAAEILSRAAFHR